MVDAIEPKQQVKSYWEREVCGSRYQQGGSPAALLDGMEAARYRLESEILSFANFRQYAGKKVLEIGVGGGVDHLAWHQSGAEVYGIELTEAGVETTRRRLKAHGYEPGERLAVGDAEALRFPDNMFDLVYSWGVLHHTPDTKRALAEALRVLKPGGEFKAMVYHHPSWVAMSLYFLNGFLKGRWRYPLKQVVYDHLESPGTKAYTIREMREMLEVLRYKDIECGARLSAADLMEIKLSRRYDSRIFQVLYFLYPRWLVRLCGDGLGLNLLIRARK